MVILVAIGGYSISGCCWLFYCKPLVVILLVDIDGYLIGGYWWLFYYKPLLDIIGYIIIG
jgi:hypothetical protein